MKNFIQPGNVITVTTPAGGVMSGDGMLVGSIFGVASSTQPEGANVELAVEGVFELPKAGDALAQCERVFWDDVAKRVTGENNTAATLPLIGAATEAALAGAATARIRLNGATV